jgi:hypothetical protein
MSLPPAIAFVPVAIVLALQVFVVASSQVTSIKSDPGAARAAGTAGLLE